MGRLLSAAIHQLHRHHQLKAAVSAISERLTFILSTDTFYTHTDRQQCTVRVYKPDKWYLQFRTISQIVIARPRRDWEIVWSSKMLHFSFARFISCSKMVTGRWTMHRLLLLTFYTVACFQRPTICCSCQPSINCFLKYKMVAHLPNEHFLDLYLYPRGSITFISYQSLNR